MSDTQKQRDALWTLLDDIDTADDIAKSDHVLYRGLVRALAEKRHVIVEAARVDTTTTEFPAAPGGIKSNGAPGRDPTRN